MVILEIIGFIVLAVLISVIPFAVHLLALAIIDDAVKDESKQDELKRGALHLNANADAPSVEQIRKLCTIKHNGKDVLNVRMVCAMLGIKRIPRKDKKSIKRLIRV